MNLEWSILFDRLPLLLEGALVTLEITAVSLFFGSILGFFVAIFRVGRIPILAPIARIYVTALRGTPLLVQLFLIYFGLPSIGIDLAPWPSAVIGLGLNTGAYVSEIVRASILSISQSQWEAGMMDSSYAATLAFIIMPQSLKRMIPPITNQFIITLKNSSLVSLLTIEELFRRGEQIIYSTFRAFEIYLGVAAIYLIMTTILGALTEYLENRLAV
ncbi:MAG: amino acid ABC transporter permease [Anaerolineae bacterium]|nr:amino acid ABC transporter permease [Anaerolineae bacterium]